MDGTTRILMSVPKIGVLIEAPGCFPNVSVWNNMMIQAANLGIKNPKGEISKVLKMVWMEGLPGINTRTVPSV